MGAFLPILLVTHITLAVALFLPSLLLPFTMRKKTPGRITRTLVCLQGNGTLIIGAGLALTGIALVSVLGTQLLGQPWLLLALVLYAANLAIAFFIQRPGVARLLTLRGETSEQAKVRLKRWGTRQRYVSYVMAGLIGAIGFLMMTKPQI